MRSHILIITLSLSLLASCTWGGAQDNKSPYPSTPLGANVDIGNKNAPVGSSYTARGTEPFWTIDVTPGSAKLSRPTESGSLDIAFETEEDDKGGFVTIRGVKGDFFLNMTRGSCSDGMSDTKYLYNATVLVGAETLTGCALKN